MSSAIPASAAANITTLRDKLRLDLRDLTAASYVWPDAELDRHITHALAEYSLAHPYSRTARLTAVAASREFTLAGELTDPIRIARVEYPVDQFPAETVDFNYDNLDGTLTLFTTSVPAIGDDVDVHYDALHVCTTASLTLPSHAYDLVLIGAKGYAGEEWATYATNRVNLDPRAVGHYLEQARRWLSSFRNKLERPAGRGKVQSLTTYTPASRGTRREDTDPGP